MIKTSPDVCKTCKYKKYLRSTYLLLYCDYLCMTGKRRGCNIGECDKYEKKES